MWWQRIVQALGVRGVPADTSDTDEFIDLVVVRLQVVVADGPIVSDTVESLDTEVRR
jgi:hypothetical protein